MTSTLHDPHYFLELVTYLTEPIDGAKYGGGVHGGTAELDNGSTPVGATVARSNAMPSITELRRSYLAR